MSARVRLGPEINIEVAVPLAGRRYAYYGLKVPSLIAGFPAKESNNGTFRNDDREARCRDILKHVYDRGLISVSICRDGLAD